MPIDQMPPSSPETNATKVNETQFPVQKSSKKRLLIIISIIVFLITSVGSYYLLELKNKSGDIQPTVTPTATPTPTPIPINIEEVEWTKVNATILTASNDGGTEGRLPLGLTGTGDSKGVFPGSIVKVDDEYKLWYTGIDDNGVYRIFMATSSDALTWKKVDNKIPAPSNAESTNGRIPLGLAGKGDEEHSRNPSVIYQDGKYLMWYSGSRMNEGDSIYQATSSNGLTWTKTDNSVAARSDTVSTKGRIPLGMLGKGDDFHIEYISVVAKDQNNFFAYYSGENNNQSGPSQISIYAAKSEDKGTTWEKVNNAVSTNSTEGRIAIGDAGSDDHSGVALQNVLFDNNTFYMWYTGFNDDGKITSMQAKSTDGLAWTKLSPKVGKTSDWLLDNEGVNSQNQVVVNVVVYKDQDQIFLVYSATTALELPLYMYTATGE